MQGEHRAGLTQMDRAPESSVVNVELSTVSKEQAAHAYIAIASLQEHYAITPEDQDALWSAYRVFASYLLRTHGCFPDEAEQLQLNGAV